MSDLGMDTQPWVIRFGSFEIYPTTGEIKQNGERIRLQEQPFQVLVALLEHPGRLVTRDQLRARVWSQDIFVDYDQALNTAVKKIRATLNDDTAAPRYVETVPRRGYRFIAPVEEAGTAERIEENHDPRRMENPPLLARAIYSPMGAALLIVPMLAGVLFGQLWTRRTNTAEEPG